MKMLFLGYESASGRTKKTRHTLTKSGKSFGMIARHNIKVDRLLGRTVCKKVSIKNVGYAVYVQEVWTHFI